MILHLTQGRTAPVPLTLEEDGEAAVLTGLTVTAILKDRDGNEIATTGDVEVTSGAAGEIEWTPDAADLEAASSPYTLRFKVTGADGDVFFPEGEPDYVQVWPQ